MTSEWWDSETRERAARAYYSAKLTDKRAFKLVGGRGPTSEAWARRISGSAFVFIAVATVEVKNVASVCFSGRKERLNCCGLLF